jgi:hypothetical protein
MTQKIDEALRNLEWSDEPDALDNHLADLFRKIHNPSADPGEEIDSMAMAALYISTLSLQFLVAIWDEDQARQYLWEHAKSAIFLAKNTSSLSRDTYKGLLDLHGDSRVDNLFWNEWSNTWSNMDPMTIAAMIVASKHNDELEALGNRLENYRKQLPEF